MYFKPLNYSDTLHEVTSEMYAPFKYHMLNLEQRLNVVGETHRRMRQHALNAVGSIKRSGLH